MNENNVEWKNDGKVIIVHFNVTLPVWFEGDVAIEVYLHPRYRVYHSQPNDDDYYNHLYNYYYQEQQRPQRKYPQQPCPFRYLHCKYEMDVIWNR
jgi:hypothetical protein